MEYYIFLLCCCTDCNAVSLFLNLPEGLRDQLNNSEERKIFICSLFELVFDSGCHSSFHFGKEVIIMETFLEIIREILRETRGWISCFPNHFHLTYKRDGGTGTLSHFIDNITIWAKVSIWSLKQLHRKKNGLH